MYCFWLLQVELKKAASSFAGVGRGIFMVGYGRMYIEDGGVEMVRYVIACSSHLWILLLKSRVAALVSSLFIPEMYVYVLCQ